MTALLNSWISDMHFASGCIRMSKKGGCLCQCVLIVSRIILFILFLQTAFPFLFDTIKPTLSKLNRFFSNITLKLEPRKSVPVLNSREISFLLESTCSFISLLFKSRNGFYFSSETVSFFLPLALLALITSLPPFVALRVRNPWVFALFLLDGWYVLFIISPFFVLKNDILHYNLSKYFILYSIFWFKLIFFKALL